MKKPYVICHLISSLDGRISGDSFYLDETAKAMNVHWKIRADYHCEALLNGTMVTDSTLIVHATNVMAAMGAMAEHFGEDKEHWQAMGFLHDFDNEKYPKKLSASSRHFCSSSSAGSIDL